jgi:hypothetical protein
MYYTIKESKYVKPVKTKYGDFSAYEITVEDKEGNGTTCQLLQKPETPEPMVDGQIHGFIEDTDFGFKFKETQPEDGGGSMAPKPQQQGSQPSTASGINDTQNQIIRQSSLKVAADLCIARQSTDVDAVIQMASLLADWATTGKVRSVNQVTEDVSPDEVPL